MNKLFLFLFLFILLLKNVSPSSGLTSDQYIQSNYWNSYFPKLKSTKLADLTQLETDIFKCHSKLKDQKTMRISWQCITKIHNVLWIPNKKTLGDRKRFLISFTDTLGTLYAFPYSQKKLLNLCTSTSIDVFGQFNEKGVAILPKDFTFLTINECINY
ncbi:uncharacterized protein cubi_02532 [Cryptosporidium ubiquitum]|uniref:Uncharacterized protein n=1 Tax=Cryptosporidium ubiquitum TaxID=857276 RepID=A0A1J4MGI9_9CRYT|nr:uncharacterized protein cubi_02532 [Cryptosporidium ubiquitum]OII73320.1 hypothetical protein cubi_02532 [Cryptosporidium ubiquitum]